MLIFIVSIFLFNNCSFSQITYYVVKGRVIDKNTKVLVQGITGSAGAFHARGCRDYGTQVVGGVTPGKGGTFVDQIPVFDTVEQAVRATGADADSLSNTGTTLITGTTTAGTAAPVVNTKDGVKLFSGLRDDPILL